MRWQRDICSVCVRIPMFLWIWLFSAWKHCWRPCLFIIKTVITKQVLWLFLVEIFKMLSIMTVKKYIKYLMAVFYRNIQKF